jgi:gamma-glutamyl hydrolase
MPIPYDTDNATLETIFQSINGILFPGGSTTIMGTPFKSNQGPSKYTQSAAYLFNRAIAANDAGDFFPIMGICLGHEVVTYILNGYAKVQNYLQLLEHAYPR